MLVLPRVYLVAGFTLAIALGGVLVSYRLEQGGPQTQPIPFHTITRGLGGDRVSPLAKQASWSTITSHGQTSGRRHSAHLNCLAVLPLPMSTSPQRQCLPSF